MHLQAVRAKANLVQQSLCVLDPALRSQITFQVMAITDQSTGHHDSVGSLLESLQHVQGV